MIIGFAGKKQSGKNTAANFILMMKFLEMGVCKHARLNSQGELEVSDILGQTIPDMDFFPFKPPNVQIDTFFQNYGQYIKLYSFAYKLKEICMDLFGLTHEQCYGTDEDKNTKTKIKWEDMPGIVADRTTWKDLNTGVMDAEKYLKYHKRGYMTAREVLQYFGTEIGRKIKSDCWTAQLINQIQKDNPEIALVTDVRFENELKAIQKAGGKTIFLKRNYQSSDSHASETGIPDPNVCDVVLDNTDMTIPEQNKELFHLLKDNDILTFNMV